MSSNLQKHTMNLREGDMAYLESVYKVQGIAPSLIVRSLVSTHVDKLKAKEAQAHPDSQPSSIQTDITL